MRFIQPQCHVPCNYMQYKTEHFLRSFIFFTSGMKSAKCSKKTTLLHQLIIWSWMKLLSNTNIKAAVTTPNNWVSTPPSGISSHWLVYRKWHIQKYWTYPVDMRSHSLALNRYMLPDEIPFGVCAGTPTTALLTKYCTNCGYRPPGRPTHFLLHCFYTNTLVSTDNTERITAIQHIVFVTKWALSSFPLRGRKIKYIFNLTDQSSSIILFYVIIKYISFLWCSWIDLNTVLFGYD